MQHPLRTALGVTLSVGLAAGGLFALATPASAATGGVLIYGLTESNTLVQFRAETPGLRNGPTRVISGLGAGDDLVGIDVRPATGELYGVVDGTSVDRLVTIDPATGAATAVANLSEQLRGTNFGVDFNPQADRLRIVSDAEQNLRIVPTSGVNAVDPAPLLGTDDDLQYAVGDRRFGTDPSVRAVGYDSNVPGGNPLTNPRTELYDIDVAGVDVVAEQDPPNRGTLLTLGATGVDVATQNGAATSTANVGLDVEAVTDRAYAVLQTQDGADVNLYRIDIADGVNERRATLVGTLFASDGVVEDLAIASPRFSVGDASANEGSAATVTVTRTGDLADTATVDLLPAAGSASAADFDPATRTVTFAAGAATASTGIALTADAVVEPSETFTVGITRVVGPGGNGAATSTRGTVTILDGPGAPAPGSCGTSRPVLSVSPSTIVAGRSAAVRVTNLPPNSVVELYAYTRPSTTYRKVREAEVAGTSTTFPAVVPPRNTRLYAVVQGCPAASQSASVVLNVRTALSLSVKRNGPRSYTFSGDSLPARPGGLLINLYRVTPSGAQVLTAQTRARAVDGEWTINRRFTGSGRFGFVVRTGQDLQNAAGSSTTRPVLIF